MEVCMKKPEVKKKTQPAKPLLRPTESKRNELERRERPTPVVPPRPTHAEMSHMRRRTKISATSNIEQQAIKEKPSETPVVPSRPTEKELKATTRYHEHRKSSRQTDQPASVDETDFRQSVVSGMFRRSQKEKTPMFISYITDIFDEQEKRDDVLVRQAPKPGVETLRGDLSASSNSLSKNKGKGGFFGLLRKTPKAAAEENLASYEEVSQSNESLTEAASTKKKSQDEPSSSRAENEPKEKGGIFSGTFKTPPKPAGAAQSKEDRTSDTEVPVSSENLSENNLEKGGVLFNGFIKKTSIGERTETPDRETQRELSASSEDVSENNTEKKSGPAGIFKRSLSLDNLFDEDKDIFSIMFKKTPKPSYKESNTSEDKKLFESSENLLEVNSTKEKPGGLAGIFKKSPKPSPRSVATQDPLSDSKQLSASWDSLSELWKEDDSAQEELSDTTSTTKDKGVSRTLRQMPKYSEQQEDEEIQPLTGAGLKPRRTIKMERRVVSFRIKTTFPKMHKQSSEKEEMVELQEMNATQEKTVVVQPADLAAYPTEENPGETQQEINELMEWWNTVKGWTEWNESSNFQEEDEEMAMEQAADRVYMAARVFVHLFNQRGASLQQRILELMALADDADEFHKKTVSAAVGGGVASVVGSIATITGLILAPFTFGASIIVTAVGISVATAGSITSATANITDTVHSNMDRKKVEKMIQGYQEEITDIRECLQFVQEGMDTLQEWDFDKFSQSAAKKSLNHNIKHVMKEGGRAGKALMINTDKLISTVQVLGAAGGAAKATKAISVTTGVMSALFLVLDVFFLAKDSHELRKGAKTKFASKIRQVCKELQEGLLEMNKVKTQLQKTMDGIEVEEYEEIEEVDVEVEEESDPKKLAELEQEIDFLEKKLDNRDDEQEKNKEMEKDIFQIKRDKKDKSGKEKGELGETKEKEKIIETNTKTEEKGESMKESKLETIPDEKRKINETSLKI